MSRKSPSCARRSRRSISEPQSTWPLHVNTSAPLIDVRSSRIGQPFGRVTTGSRRSAPVMMSHTASRGQNFVGPALVTPCWSTNSALCRLVLVWVGMEDVDAVFPLDGLWTPVDPRLASFDCSGKDVRPDYIQT